MGCVKIGSSSKCDNKREYTVSSINETLSEKALPNPNPSRWRILSHYELDKYLVIKINYPDCTNYEGNKILVFEDVTLSKLTKQKMIDPHFSENKKYHSPVARFEPTESGWIMAKMFVAMMKKVEKKTK